MSLRMRRTISIGIINLILFVSEISLVWPYGWINEDIVTRGNFFRTAAPVRGAQTEEYWACFSTVCSAGVHHSQHTQIWVWKYMFEEVLPCPFAIVWLKEYWGIFSTICSTGVHHSQQIQSWATEYVSNKYGHLHEVSQIWRECRRGSSHWYLRCLIYLICSSDGWDCYTASPDFPQLFFIE